SHGGTQATQEIGKGGATEVLDRGASQTMGDQDRSESPGRDQQMRDQMDARVRDGTRKPIAPSIRSRFGWLFQVVRIRLRFLLIVIFAGAIVSQWPLIRGIWDRWTWVFS